MLFFFILIINENINMSNKIKLPIGNLKPETIIPIVTDGLTSKITFNELKVKITPFEYGQDGEGLN
jgi:hypothetical protein